MKVILTGGGTMGSVSPLLAVSKELDQADLLFIGTNNGPEKSVVQRSGIKFRSIMSGKFRKYWDIRNIIDAFKICLAFWQSLFLLIKEKPDVIVSAGGFVAVPLICAGWILRIPSVVHSQDIVTGLAIKLTKPFAKKITKAFPDTDLKAEIIGNPVKDLTPNTNRFNLKQDKPVVLVTGGGTGALSLNKLISKELLHFAQVIHITGKNKNVADFSHPDYHVFDFLDTGIEEALSKADLVVSRAGLGALSELSNLAKPAIIVPLPHSHQVANAKYFADKQAVIYLEQTQLTPTKLNQTIKELLTNTDKLKSLSININSIVKPYAAKKWAQIIQQVSSGT